MYVRRNIRWSIIWQFSGRSVFFFAFYSAAIVVLYNVAITHGVDLSIPFAPLGTLGIAVAFYIGFKNNQAYDRFWEARKIWGGIVNDSRSWANLVLSLISPSAEQPDADMEPLHRRLILRQLAWINSVRTQLRKTTIRDRTVHTSFMPNLKIDLVRGSKDNICKFLSEDERARLSKMENVASHLLRVQGEEIKELRKANHLDGFQERMLHEVIRELYALQGKCERIKNTPLPRQFSYFSAVFVWLFILVLPFGLLSQFEQMENHGMIWLTVPFSVLISWVFNTVEVVGDTSEDPFENYINDVPMTAICRTIEVDLLQMLGDTELPDPVLPERDILL